MLLGACSSPYLFSIEDFLCPWIIRALNHSWTCLHAELPAVIARYSFSEEGGGASLFTPTFLMILLKDFSVVKDYLRILAEMYVGVFSQTIENVAWIWKKKKEKTQLKAPGPPWTSWREEADIEVSDLGADQPRGFGLRLSALTDGRGGSDRPASAG